MHAAILAGVLPLLSGCATSPGEHGWSGEHAQPFDDAREACEHESDARPKAEQPAALEACMARRGWRRR
nr:hypothetical protein [Pseudoxanthomonas sp.]